MRAPEPSAKHPRDQAGRYCAGSGDMGCTDGIPDPWLVDGVFICSPVYSITQADIDAGLINNSVRCESYRTAEKCTIVPRVHHCSIVAIISLMCCAMRMHSPETRAEISLLLPSPDASIRSKSPCAHSSVSHESRSLCA